MGWGGERVGRVGGYAHSHMPTWRPEINVDCILLMLSTLVLSQVFHWPGAHLSARLVGQQGSGVCLLQPIRCARVTTALLHLAFSVLDWAPDSGPLVCVANTVLSPLSSPLTLLLSM